MNSKASDLPIHFYLSIVLWDPQKEGICIHYSAPDILSVSEPQL